MSAIYYESNTIFDIVSEMKKVDLRLPIDDCLRIKKSGDSMKGPANRKREEGCLSQQG